MDLTIGDVCRITGLSQTSVRKWTDSGALASYRIGRRRDRRVKQHSLAAFMVLNEMPIITGIVHKRRG